MSVEIVERGIDNLRVGQLITIGMSSLMDNGYYIDGTRKIIARMPAIIIKKHYTDDDWPIYDIGFWTRSKEGEKSSMIIMNEICVWRYMQAEEGEPEEGTPPNWLLYSIENDVKTGNYEYFSGISSFDICYVEKGYAEDGSEDFWVYPFRKYLKDISKRKK